MDNRRLSTEEVMLRGIIEAPAPVTDIPDDREEAEFDAHDLPERDEIERLLTEGKLVSVPEYYGLAYIWQRHQLGAFRGILLQYRAVTEDKTFASAIEAAEWLIGITARIAG